MIATVFALEFESAAFRASQGRRLCVSIWALGVAGERSAPALERMIGRSRPVIVVSAGFSGALQPGLALGDIVIGENFSDPQLLKTLHNRPDYHIGKIITATNILETAAAKRSLGEISGALAGDLESSHIARVCSTAGIPMLSVRTISDVLDQDLPVPGAVLINPETGKSDPSAIFRHLFRHPSKAPQFAQLVRGASVAQQSLAKALASIIPPILMRGNPGI